MTTEAQTPAPDEAPESTPEPEVTSSQSPAELRAYAERQAAENKRLRKELMTERLGQVGLDHETGVGKAIYKDMEKGDYSGELTVDAIRGYAEAEYGHKAGTQTEPPVPAAEATNRADQLGQAEIAQTPPPVLDQTQEQLAAAEAALAKPEAGRREAQASIGAKVRGFVEDHLN